MKNNYFECNCYKLIELDNNRIPPVFNNIDATYVVHLENNGRLQSVINQLTEYKLTNITYILYQKGYRKCKKNLYRQTIDKDITHCNMTIFKHALNKGYNNIIVLEDDFIINSKIKDENIVNDVSQFIKKKEEINENFVYYLGGIPIISIPISINHYKPWFIAGTHGAVFSNKSMKYILKNYKVYADTDEMWDLHLSSDSNIKKYHYKYPLVYQLFPITDNQSQWNISNCKIVNNIMISTFKLLIKLINIDKECEPGFTIIYTFSILSFYVILFISFFILFKLIKKFNIK